MQADSTGTLNNLTQSDMIANDTIIRFVISFLVVIIIIFVLLVVIKFTRKLIYKIFSQTSAEFFIPLLILWDVLICEKLIHDLVSQEMSSIKAFLNHFIYELLIIYITYSIFFGNNIWEKIRNQNKKEILFWRNYRKELEDASETISALNVRDYNLFSEPLGVRYFLEQIKVLNDSRRGNKNIIAQRIIVISAADRKDILSSEEIKAIINTDDLNDAQRNFYNVYLLHRLHDIKLFLAPKNEIMQLIKVTGWNKWWKKKSEFKNLDRLLIDKKCWSPTNKGEHLVFEEDPDRKDVVRDIITKYTESIYNIEEFKKESTKP